MTPDKFAVARNMDELYSLLNEAHMGPGWNKPEPSMYPTPKKSFVPAHWPYRIARAALDCAARYVKTEFAERRNLILNNPVPGNTYATAPTIVAAYQMIKGHETARSHRHTPNAMRFILDSKERAYTVVEGKLVPMEPGDVLLTPNWAWHGHDNKGPDCAYWIDFLDAPLTHLLGPMFFQQLQDKFVQESSEVAADSPFRFPYAVWGARVRAQPESAPGMREVTLGPPHLDTIRLKWRHFKPAARVNEARTTASRIYAVHEGSGTALCDGKSIAWERGDVFVIPAWNDVQWTVGPESCLLQASDEILLEKLNWLHSGAPGSEMHDAEARFRARF